MALTGPPPLADAPAAVPERATLVGRFAYARDGRLHGPRLLAGVVLAVALITLSTFTGLLLAGMGSPEQLAVWVLAGFLLVKVPLLAVLWWVLMRRPADSRPGGWSGDECEEILRYLERSAADAADRPGAPERLAYFAREAWYVADHAADADRPRAAETAARLHAMAEGARHPERSAS